MRAEIRPRPEPRRTRPLVPTAREAYEASAATRPVEQLVMSQQLHRVETGWAVGHRQRPRRSGIDTDDLAWHSAEAPFGARCPPAAGRRSAMRVL